MDKDLLNVENKTPVENWAEHMSRLSGEGMCMTPKYAGRGSTSQNMKKAS